MNSISKQVIHRHPTPNLTLSHACGELAAAQPPWNSDHGLVNGGPQFMPDLHQSTAHCALCVRLHTYHVNFSQRSQSPQVHSWNIQVAHPPNMLSYQDRESESSPPLYVCLGPRGVTEGNQISRSSYILLLNYDKSIKSAKF